MPNDAEPDYAWWAKADSWGLKESALLLHGLDPYLCRQLRLTESEVPAEFIKVKRTYFLLQSISWKEKYPSYTLRQ